MQDFDRYMDKLNQAASAMGQDMDSEDGGNQPESLPNDGDQPKLAFDTLPKNSESSVQKDIAPPIADQINDTDDQVQPPSSNEWKPDFKFKVGDNEFEIDEKYRDFIKDPERENYLKDLHVKSKQLEQVLPQAQQLYQVVQEMQNYAKADFKKLINFLQIPEDQVMKYAQERASYHLLKDEEKQRIDNQMRYETELEQTRRQVEQMKVQSLQSELQLNLSRPDVSSFAQAYDQATGIPNGFVHEIINRGIAYSNQGREVTPTQVVQEVMSTYGRMIQQQPQHQAAPMPPHPYNQPQAAPAQTGYRYQGSTIPSYGRSSAAPAKKKVTNFDQYQQAIKDALGER